MCWEGVAMAALRRGWSHEVWKWRGNSVWREQYTQKQECAKAQLCFCFCFNIYLFIYLAVPGLSCGTQDPVPWPVIEPRPPALGARNLNHWNAREGRHDYVWETQNGMTGDSRRSINTESKRESDERESCCRYESNGQNKVLIPNWEATGWQQVLVFSRQYSFTSLVHA